MVMKRLLLDRSSTDCGVESSSFNILGDNKIQNLAFNPTTRRFEWEGPQAPERCDLHFIVEFTNGDPSDDISVRIAEEYFEAPIYSCTHNHIHVTTWLGLLHKEAGSESITFLETAPGIFSLWLIKLRKQHFFFFTKKSILSYLYLLQAIIQNQIVFMQILCG